MASEPGGKPGAWKIPDAKEVEEETSNKKQKSTLDESHLLKNMGLMRTVYLE